jgi:hypothetical protein
MTYLNFDQSNTSVARKLVGLVGAIASTAGLGVVGDDTSFLIVTVIELRV